MHISYTQIDINVRKRNEEEKKNLDPNRNNFSMLSHKNLIIPDSETFLNPII